MQRRSRVRRAALDGLRSRVTASLFSTGERFEAQRRAAQLDNRHHWNSSPAQQTAAFSVWFSALSWQLIYEFLEGNTEDGDAPPDVTAWVTHMCAEADAWTDFAVRVQHHVDSAPPPPVSLQGWRVPAPTPANVRGVWRMADTIATWVERDWSALTAQGVPSRFEGPEHGIRAALEPNRRLIHFLREQWLLSSDVGTQVNIATRAVPPATALFVAGQRMWAPYLMGGVYRDALRRPPGLDDLLLGFDPWLLTDPADATERRADPDSVRALAEFWSTLGNPGQAKRLADELADACRRQRIRYRTPKGYPFAPWPAQYLVRFPVTFGERSFQPGELIGLFVTDTRPAKVEVRKGGRVRTRAEMLGV